MRHAPPGLPHFSPFPGARPSCPWCSRAFGDGEPACACLVRLDPEPGCPCCEDRGAQWDLDRVWRDHLAAMVLVGATARRCAVTGLDDYDWFETAAREAPWAARLAGFETCQTWEMRWVAGDFGDVEDYDAWRQAFPDLPW